jgi:hypothetical protein
MVTALAGGMGVVALAGIVVFMDGQFVATSIDYFAG